MRRGRRDLHPARRASPHVRQAVRGLPRPLQVHPPPVSEPEPMTDPLADMRASLRPYRDRVDSYARIPPQGRDREVVLAEMAEMADAEREQWLSGHASGAVYQGDPGHV